ncbi:unnamed protein product [Orchesella dallaii]|uniref:CUB domain-containing protein n=1 Tax=Orchesella dallaii TaxID=48710 RepID=A0ABP1RLA3_9HEXA
MQIFAQTFAVFLATFVALTLGTPAEFQNHVVLEEPLYVSCGGVLNTSTATISYKPDSSISPNERCVWTIRSAATRGYSLDVLSFGLQSQPEETGVVATCIRSDIELLPSVEIFGTGAVTLSSVCPILVITYYSGENVDNSTGFAVTYNSISGSTGVSSGSRQYISNGDEGYVRHPSTACTTYTNLEVSSFIFMPPDNIHNPDKKSSVTYTLNSLEEDGCIDNLRVFRFSPSIGWLHNYSIPEDYICGNTTFKSWAIDDMLMLIFRSDVSDVYNGFQLTYTNLPTSNSV